MTFNYRQLNRLKFLKLEPNHETVNPNRLKILNRLNC